MRLQALRDSNEKSVAALQSEVTRLATGLEEVRLKLALVCVKLILTLLLFTLIAAMSCKTSGISSDVQHAVYSETACYVDQCTSSLVSIS